MTVNVFSKITSLSNNKIEINSNITFKSIFYNYSILVLNQL